MNAAIVGCGNIAGFYDTPSSDEVLTHAHAFALCDKTKLVACCDITQVSLQKFTAVWGSDIRTYLSVEEMLKHEDIDLIVIASNTESHYEVLEKVFSQTNIKHIICEKPFVSTIEEFESINKLIAEKNPNLLINYTRCFDPSINRVKKLLKKETLGKILHFSGRFNKGLYHNGSHMLSLAEHFFGVILELKSIFSKVVDDDLYGTYALKTKKASGIITNFLETNFSIFEMEIICENGIIKIYDSGFDIKIYKVENSKKVKGTTQLTLFKTLKQTLKYNTKNSLHFLLHKNSQKQRDKHLRLSLQLLEIKNELMKESIDKISDNIYN